MKNGFFVLLLMVMGMGLWSCQPEIKGTQIDGKISDAANMQVFVDKVTLNKANAVLEKMEIPGSGEFSFSFPEGLEAGIYNLRIGSQRAHLILDGAEKKIEITGSLQDLGQMNYQVKGSPHTQSYVDMVKGLNNRRYNADDLNAFIDTVSNPFTAAFITYQMGNDGRVLPYHKAAHQKLVASYPNDPSSIEYGNLIQVVERQYNLMKANEKIQVGQPAPDITAPNPQGKEMSLSDLKGKIVLLDFWASWCGPCRRENPNVVKVYEKYKDQGFTVFSVSLDGLDNRTKARLGEDQIDKYLKNEKRKWQAAIEQDDLKWDYHVSELRKWDTQAAATYGVRGIPKAFMIDRDGTIGAVGVRGAAMIERELKRLL